MTKLKPLALGAIFATAGLILGGCAPAEPTPILEKIVITGNPQDDDPNPAKRFQLLMDIVEEATGLPVEFYDSATNAGTAEAIISGQAQIAHMEAFSYIVASNRNPDLKVIAGSSRGRDVAPGYISVGITRVESDINSLEDLRGQKLCYNDPASAGGFLYPGAALRKLGIEPDPGLGTDVTAVYTGTFAGVGVGVYNKDCVAGFVTDGTVANNLPKLDNINVDELRVFWESDLIAGPPLVAHPSLPAEMVEKIKVLLYERANKDYMIAQGMCDVAANCEFLTNTAWGYVPTDASAYDSVRLFCKENEITECQ